MILPLGAKRGLITSLGRSVQRAAGGVWYTLDGAITSCVAAYQPKGAANLAASKVNLANPGTYDLTATTDPAFDTSYGWSFTAALLNQLTPAGLVPDGNATWSMIARFSDGATLMGTIQTVYYGFCFNTGTAWHMSGTYNGGDGIVNNPPALTAGVYGIAGITAYRNGIAEPNQANGVNSISNWTMGIGGFMFTSNLHDCSTSKIQACAIYNATLTAEQMAALTTAMNAL